MQSSQHAEPHRYHCRVLELAQKELQKATQEVGDKERRAVAAQTAASQVPPQLTCPVTTSHSGVVMHTAPSTADGLVVPTRTEEGRR